MRYLQTLGAAALLALAAPAAADTLTFGELARDGTGLRYLGSTVTVGDYVFNATYGGDESFIVFDRGHVQNADPGGATLGYRWDNNLMWMSRTDGQAFDLTSIDVDDIFGAGSAFANDLYFDFGGGRIEQMTFTTDTVAGLQTLLLNANGLQRFGLIARSRQWWQFDNIVVNPAAAPSAVPEPATWAMMLIGFGAIGASFRRRRTPAVA